MHRHYFLVAVPRSWTFHLPCCVCLYRAVASPVLPDAPSVRQFRIPMSLFLTRLILSWEALELTAGRHLFFFSFTRVLRSRITHARHHYPQRSTQRPEHHLREPTVERKIPLCVYDVLLNLNETMAGWSIGYLVWCVQRVRLGKAGTGGACVADRAFVCVCVGKSVCVRGRWTSGREGGQEKGLVWGQIAGLVSIGAD